jgi:hypothetical protein
MLDDFLKGWTMRKSRYDEAESGDKLSWMLVKSFSATESTNKIGDLQKSFMRINCYL